jgi:hypothetical protein
MLPDNRVRKARVAGRDLAYLCAPPASPALLCLGCLEPVDS